MSNKRYHSLTLLFVLHVIIAIASSPVNGLISRKLDDTSVTGPPDTSIKCGSCSYCNNACGQTSPPPPPPSPPPPAPKKPPTQYCPPPPAPPSAFIYITGPPGNLYPINPYYSGARRNLAAGFPLWIGCALVGLLALW